MFSRPRHNDVTSQKPGPNCYCCEVIEEPSVKVGDVVELATERMSYGGDAVARYHGLAVFIPLAAPGETLRVRIVERKKNFARATIEEILVPRSSRRKAPCQHFGECGGCQLQHMDYETQLEAKAGFVRDALLRIGKVEWPHQIMVRPSPEFGYRIRAQVKVERSSTEAFKIGFTRAASHSVCDLVSCPILSPRLESSLHQLRGYLNERAEELDTLLQGRRLAEVELAEGSSGVAVTPNQGPWPEGELTLKVRGATYTYSPDTFFQVNRFLLDELVQEAVTGEDGCLALDLYAGVGLFAIQLASKFEKVVAVESATRAASYARRNAVRNGLSNVEVHESMVETFLRQMIESNPDLVLLDPPRSGAYEAINLLAQLRARRITYVSCDPTTLARDIKPLVASQYSLERVVAFDLFPQTYHVETVVSLRLK